MMNLERKAHGVFVVRIGHDGGKTSVELTGDHFDPDEMDEARIVSVEDGKESYARGGQPVFLVKDSVVGLATGLYGSYVMAVASNCHNGPNGRPCGKCRECIDAKSRAFTAIVLPAVELPDSDLSKRLFESVSNTIGMTSVDAPWSRKMSRREISSVFKKMGVKPANKERK